MLGTYVMSIKFSVSTNEFIERYQEKKPLLMKGAVSADIFSWRDANEIFERCDVSANDLKLSYEGIRPKSEYVESYWDIGTLRHRLIKPAVYDFLRKGATLIANKIANEPAVNQFATKVAEFTGRQVVSSAYAAFGSRDSFRCHWDTRDIFAIQLIGRKRWIVYEPSFEAPLYTQQSKDYEHEYPCPETPCMDFILEPGDIFYLPRGWWHNPLPIGEATFHLALGTFPAYTVDYLDWAIKQMPAFLEARRSLSDWENDQSTLVAVGHHFNSFINDPKHYQHFMDEFVGATRTQSPLAIELFGNPASTGIPKQAGLRLNVHRTLDLDDGYLIANGTRLNLDGQGVRLIRWISEHPETCLAELITTHPDINSDKLCNLLTELCRQDVLELSHT